MYCQHNVIDVLEIFRRQKISTLSDKWAEQKRLFRDGYFQYINPKLGKLREKASDHNFLKRLIFPDDFFLWFGIAAGITGLLLLLDASLSWYWQLFLLVIITFLAPIIFRFIKSIFGSADHVLTVYPGKNHIGKRITLEKAIENGKGEHVLQGESWTLKGDNLPAGTRVKIVAVKKNILYVVNAMGSFEEE